MILVNGRKKQELFTGQIINGQNPSIPQIAHYSFDNISGATVADETGSYPGTLINGPQVVAGVLGNGTDFDPASNQYIDAGTAMGTALGNGVSALSVSLWFKADAPITDNGGLFQIGDFLGNDGQILLAIDDSKIKFRLPSLTTDSAFTDSAGWHMVVVMYTGSRAIMHLDDIEVVNVAYSTDLNLTGLKTIVGAYHSSPFTFDGKIDQVRIHNGVWTTDQINQLFNEKPEPWIFRNGKAA